MKLGFAAFGLVLALTGCATQNTAGISTYQLVPAERVTAMIIEPSPGEAAGTIIVKRDPGIWVRARGRS
jgi:hypothetical protein